MEHPLTPLHKSACARPLSIRRRRSNQDRTAHRDWRSGPAWLQSWRMRATNQQTLISAAVFEAAERATQDLTHLVPDLDRDRAEYAVASVLLEEAWVAKR